MEKILQDLAIRFEPNANEQDRQISETIAKEQSKLRLFIRQRVPDLSDAEDILQDVFFELTNAYRLMKPVEKVGAWLFRVARNRITDLFRRRKYSVLGNDSMALDEDGERRQWEDFIAATDIDPATAYRGTVFIEELEAALEKLPNEQREVFIAHEMEGLSFREISAQTGVPVNTLLSRKRYAVLQLRLRLKPLYDEFGKGQL